jgi:hypothetical protein
MWVFRRATLSKITPGFMLAYCETLTVLPLASGWSRQTILVLMLLPFSKQKDEGLTALATAVIAYDLGVLPYKVVASSDK